MTLRTPPNAQRNWERRASELRNTAQLRAVLETKHGIASHPKAPLLWSLAYEWGHAHGDESIREYYDDMARLLK